MKASMTWALGAEVLPAGGLAVSPDGTVLVVDGAGSRLLGPKGVARQARVTGGEGSLLSAAGAGGHRFCVVAGTEGRPALWDADTGQLTALGATPAARAIACASTGETVWMLDGDGGLRKLAGGAAERIGTESYNALAISADGAQIAARRRGSDDLVLSGTRSLDWKVVRTNFAGELLGFDSGGALLLLELGVWEKEDEPPESTVVAIAQGKSTTLLRGPFSGGVASGAHLVLIRRLPDGALRVELYEPHA